MIDVTRAKTRIVGDALTIAHALVRSGHLVIDSFAANGHMSQPRLARAVEDIVNAGIASVVNVDGVARLTASAGFLGQQHVPQPDEVRDPEPAAIHASPDQPGDSEARVIVTGAAPQRLDMLAGARRRAAMAIAHPVITLTELEHLVDRIACAARRGVAILISVDISHAKSARFVERASELTGDGVAIGHSTRQLKQSALVVDGAHASITDRSCSNRPNVSVVSDPVVCNALDAYAVGALDGVDTAQSGQSYAGVSRAPTPIERRVVRLLAEGLTDVVAAKRIGVQRPR